MKTILILVTVWMALPIIAASAQEKDFNNAYWVMERNISNRDVSLIKFYDADHHLIHEVKIEGRVINLGRRGDKRKIDMILRRYTDRTISSGRRHKSRSSV